MRVVRLVLRGMAAFACATLLIPTVAAAQERVHGNLPEESPYRDIPWRGNVSVVGGWMFVPSDPAGVSANSGPMFGTRLDLRLAGPLDFSARLGSVVTDRAVIDPVRPESERDLGTTSTPLTFLDLGFALNLTGARTWRSLQPQLRAGIGVVGDFQAADVGDYRLGTRFSLALGAGVRWVPEGSRYSLMLDITDNLFRQRYPPLYYGDPSIPEGIPPVLESGTAASRWTNNFAITLGAAYHFWR